MNALIMFAKAPVAERVKTRLCPPLAPAQAAALYRAFAMDTLETLMHVPGARLMIAYDGAPADSPAWLGSEAEWFPQAGLDLGERLVDAFARAFERGAERAVIVGSDMPDLAPGQVERAFEALARADAVLGPAEDGGYYLVGLSKPSPALFRSIEWSTPRVLEQTMERIRQANLAVELLEPYRDIDDGDDLAALEKRLRGTLLAPHTRSVLSEIREEARGS